tara:strand:+ start:244 stop:2454 length:2211 start_codon:yes stop_codon:yes gene_type:complete
MIEHQAMIERLKDSQEADSDLRDSARQSLLFVNKRNGQWEPEYYQENDGKPRYSFDLTSPIVDQVAGEIELSDFSINVSPAGGAASKETAKLLSGLIRNIENISYATDIYSASARSMVTSGLDGWKVSHNYVDSDSFDQDLIIEPIYNYVDRVWWDVASEKQDASDARFCWVLSGLSVEDYEKQYPKGSGQSVSEDRSNQAYFNRPDLIMVGEYYFIKQEEREIVMMSSGQVLEDNEDFNTIKDELAAMGVTEVKRRKRKKDVVYIRKFDAQDWLGPEQKTVFSLIPVIPTYANFKNIEDKSIYWGIVEKLLDPQRVLNYSLSREIEEGALAPRAKYWMTNKQASGHEAELSTMNTNTDPVQFYNVDELSPGVPQQNGGANINPGLRTISEGMRGMISQSAGLFAANMGDNPGLQSGVAIKQLQNKGDTGTVKYFKSQEIAIARTAKVLIDAIPRVYDTERQVRIMNEDGTSESETLNQTVIDQQTGQPITLNDLSIGSYDVICSSGVSFQNRQQESNAALLEMAQIDPSLIQMSGDVMLKNVDAPGMDILAERKRQQLLTAGAIPAEQQTDEEQQMMAQQAQSQGEQPDAMMVAAQAEMQKAQAMSDKNQLAMQKLQLDAQRNQQAAQLDAQKQQMAMQAMQIKLQNEQAQFELDKQMFMKEQGDKLNMEAIKLEQSQQRIDNEKHNSSVNSALKLTEMELEINRELNEQVKENIDDGTHQMPDGSVMPDSEMNY